MDSSSPSMKELLSLADELKNLDLTTTDRCAKVSKEPITVDISKLSDDVNTNSSLNQADICYQQKKILSTSLSSSIYTPASGPNAGQVCHTPDFNANANSAAVSVTSDASHNTEGSLHLSVHIHAGSGALSQSVVNRTVNTQEPVSTSSGVQSINIPDSCFNEPKSPVCETDHLSDTGLLYGEVKFRRPPGVSTDPDGVKIMRPNTVPEYANQGRNEFLNPNASVVIPESCFKVENVPGQTHKSDGLNDILEIFKKEMVGQTSLVPGIKRPHNEPVYPTQPSPTTGQVYPPEMGSPQMDQAFINAGFSPVSHPPVSPPMSENSAISMVCPPIQQFIPQTTSMSQVGQYGGSQKMPLITLDQCNASKLAHAVQQTRSLQIQPGIHVLPVQSHTNAVGYNPHVFVHSQTTNKIPETVASHGLNSAEFMQATKTIVSGNETIGVLQAAWPLQPSANNEPYQVINIETELPELSREDVEQVLGDLVSPNSNLELVQKFGDVVAPSLATSNSVATTSTGVLHHTKAAKTTAAPATRGGRPRGRPPNKPRPLQTNFKEVRPAILSVRPEDKSAMDIAMHTAKQMTEEKILYIDKDRNNLLHAVIKMGSNSSDFTKVACTLRALVARLLDMFALRTVASSATSIRQLQQLVDMANKMQQTPLMLCVLAQNLLATSIFTKDLRADANIMGRVTEESAARHSPVHVAALLPNKEFLTCLLEMPSSYRNVNLVDEYDDKSHAPTGCTALSQVCYMNGSSYAGHHHTSKSPTLPPPGLRLVEHLRLLLAAGANPLIPAQNEHNPHAGCNAFHMAAVGHSPAQTVELLITECRAIQQQKGCNAKRENLWWQKHLSEMLNYEANGETVLDILQRRNEKENSLHFQKLDHIIHHVTVNYGGITAKSHLPSESEDDIFDDLLDNLFEDQFS